ncbi:MAG: hypothetical protein RID93_42610 [Sandaracinaceae bacterium]
MSVRELIAALDAAWVSPEDATLEGLAEAVAARAPVLDAITALDPASLDEEARDALKSALERVHARDAEALAALEGERDRVTAERGKIAHARGMVRGYRNLAPHRAGAVLSTA